MGKKQEEIKFLTKEESDERILKYIKSEDKATRIIGLLARAKKIIFENNIQLNRFYARHIKSARELDCYSDEKIIRAMKYLLDNAEYKWELSTVTKFIDEDFDKLEGKEAIIVLKNGERVYSVERIKELERRGVLYYDSKGWKETDNIVS